jgi:hypothetical protein
MWSRQSITVPTLGKGLVKASHVTLTFAGAVARFLRFFPFTAGVLHLGDLDLKHCKDFCSCSRRPGTRPRICFYCTRMSSESSALRDARLQPKNYFGPFYFLLFYFYFSFCCCVLRVVFELGLGFGLS